ncbi:hypothetical protein NDU88_005823 [Pleurodeles waltl]|uniref:Uncharacterized protein n=1 Tax=Pleurodeles waltl TaxID=8319 RepID=A0AAV7NQ60_PLEWA|nr:hypothetical protein NDU88_005823 [Pleurodeles waltl]
MLRRSGPHQEQSRAPAEHQQRGVLSGHRRTTSYGRQATRHEGRHATRTAASRARLLKATAPAMRLRSPARRFRRRPGPLGHSAV